MYGLSTICSFFLWRIGFRGENRLCVWLLALGFALHTISMFLCGVAEQSYPVRNIYQATSFLAWTIVAGQFALRFVYRLKSFSAFAAPVGFCMCMLALLPGLDTPGQEKVGLDAALTSLHATPAFVAYGALGLAALASAMYLVLERYLKFHKSNAVIAILPPLEQLEAFTAGALHTGLILFTAGLFPGATLHQPTGITYLSDSKVLWSVGVWTLYFGLVLGCAWVVKLAGRKFARASVGAFTVLALSFWCTNLFSKVHHP